MSLRFDTGPASSCADPPSDLALDRLNLGTLDAAQAATVQTHLDGCPDCAARFARIGQGFDAFPDFDERPVLARVRPTRRVGWWAGVLSLAIGAAAVAFFVQRPAPDPVDPGGIGAPNGVRTKGAAALRVFRKPAGRDAEAVEALSGSVFGAGDRIRLMVDLPTAGPIAVFGREPAGEPYLFWPRAAEDAARPAGKGQLLPGASAELDDAPGPETLYLVHCPGADAVPRCSPTAEGLECADPCTVSTFVMRKAPAGAP